MEKTVIRPLSLLGAYPRKPGERLPSRLKVWPRNSPGIRTANFIFAGGTAGVDSSGQVISPEDPARQVTVALERLRGVVEGGGAPFADVFKIRWFLTAESDREPVMRGVAGYLLEHGRPGSWPVISQVVAESSSGVIRAEIEAFAATSHESLAAPGMYRGIAPDSEWEHYAHATRVGNLWFLAGQLPLDAHGQIAAEDAVGQTEKAIANVRQVLAAAGLSAANLVKLTIWIDRAEDAKAVLDTISAFLASEIEPGNYPAATVLVTPIGVPGARVQIEAIAATGTRETIQTPAVYRALPHGLLHSTAVKVRLESEAGSWLRRFTWPRDMTEEDRAQLGGRLEVQHPLGNLLFTSAIAPLTPDGSLAGADMTSQAEQVFANLSALAEAAGGRFADIAQFDIYYAGQPVYDDYNEVRVRFVEQHVPDKDWFAGSGVIAKSCVNGAFIEIEAIAAIK